MMFTFGRFVTQVRRAVSPGLTETRPGLCMTGGMSKEMLVWKVN